MTLKTSPRLPHILFKVKKKIQEERPKTYAQNLGRNHVRIQKKRRLKQQPMCKKDTPCKY